MNIAVNDIVNNLFDRFDDVLRIATPALQQATQVSSTLIMETAQLGCAFCLVGLLFLFLSALCVVGICMVKKDSHKTELFIVMCVFFFIGLCIFLGSIGEYLAPTKTVVMEVIKIIN